MVRVSFSLASFAVLLTISSLISSTLVQADEARPGIRNCTTDEQCMIGALGMAHCIKNTCVHKNIESSIHEASPPEIECTRNEHCLRIQPNCIPQCHANKCLCNNIDASIQNLHCDTPSDCQPRPNCNVFGCLDGFCVYNCSSAKDEVEEAPME
ncbi:uncharacterized protein LOC122077744 [Macadamia integrifolia]|uniref:uncharacterized protein LOC122077744 n=1 Tax=Macadamia integrifolia TaxID=60698 RepID=UPI001C4FFCEC|nr:uncharacterized protein LOC122077744 [Macadamia integrifolia]